MDRTIVVRLVLLAAVLAVFPVGAAAQTFCTSAFTPPVPPEKSCDVCKTDSKGAPKDDTAGSSVPKKKRLCDTCTGSPVYAATGNYEVEYTDLVVGTSGYPLVASRVYSTEHLIDGPAGVGWSSSFHARLIYTTYLYAAPSTYERRAAVVFPDGDHFEYTDTGSGFTPPSGRHDTLVRNADGTFDLTLQRSRSQMHFSSDGLLLSMTDDYGNALTYTYDAASGRLQRVADGSGSGRYLDITWAPNGRIGTIADNMGRTVAYSYNVDGTLASVTNAAGLTTVYTYVAGRFGPTLSQVKDHWGRVVTDLTWDTWGRLASYSDHGETYTYTYTYNNVANQSSKVDSSGNRWVYPADTNGLVTARQAPDGTTSRSTFNADGTVLSSTDEAGVKTSYTYTPDGLVTSVTKDDGGSLAVRFDYTYDTNFPEKVTSIIPKNPTSTAYDPNWQGWQYDYYPAGGTAPGALHHVYRLRDDGTTADTIATYTYDTHGRVLSVTDALGAVTDYGYDAAGDVQTVTAPSNNDAGTRPITTYGYDGAGRVTSVTDPLNNVTSYTYDPLDRITSVTLPPPTAGSNLNFTTTYSYDNYDAPSGVTFTNVTDPNTIVTKQGYDQFGRLRKSIDGLNNVTTYTYTKDLLTGITDANNNTTAYQYDVAKRLTATVFPDGAQESYTYYNDGLLRTKTDRKNQRINYSYDSLKRLLTKGYPSTYWIQYTYQGQKLTRVVDYTVSPTETHTFTYDSRFRVATNGQASRATITYTYDDADRAASYTLTGGPTASYAYYPDGRLDTIAWSPVAGTFKYTYNARGQYDSITFPDGHSRAFSYDDQGRLTQLANTHPTAGNVATFAYGYDSARLGQRTSMAADVPALGWTGAQTAYTYDAAYQLTGVTYPNVTPFAGEVGSWTYDAIGNRTSATTNGTTTNYTYQKIGTNPLNWQRLLTAGATPYTYDNNGNTATMSGYTYGVDYENRLTSISGNVTASYKYDYQGRRTTKVAGSTTTYAYDGLNLIRETGMATKDYLLGPGIDEPLAVTSAGTVSYYTVDGLGSVVALADSAGATQNTYVYDAWGVLRSVSETVAQPFRYTAREMGEVTAQWFYRARFYQSDVGRFLSEDPVGLDEGPNFYIYVVDNPLAFGDPTGLHCGPGPLGDTAILDKRWGTGDFGGPCADHDKCYSTCGVPKSTCDSTFLREMRAVCNGTRHRLFFMRYGCLNRAETFYAMVRTKEGDKIYRDSQAVACAACKKSPTK